MHFIKFFQWLINTLWNSIIRCSKTATLLFCGARAYLFSPDEGSCDFSFPTRKKFWRCLAPDIVILQSVHQPSSEHQFVVLLYCRFYPAWNLFQKTWSLTHRPMSKNKYSNIGKWNYTWEKSWFLFVNKKIPFNYFKIMSFWVIFHENQIKNVANWSLRKFWKLISAFNVQKCNLYSLQFKLAKSLIHAYIYA